MKIFKEKKQWYQDNKEKAKESAKNWASNNKEKMEEWRRQYYLDHRDKKIKQSRQNYKENGKKRRIKLLYNLSHEDWLKMWEAQNGKCAICGKIFTKPSDACVDHNHETDEVRGLLCNKCNVGIGFFKENIVLLKNAIINLSLIII